MSINTSPFYAKIKSYTYFKQEMTTILSTHPEKWEEFKNTFNSTLESVSSDIRNFEKDNSKKGEEATYKLRKAFEKRYRKQFLHGSYITQCFNKPYGYGGDFKIVDDIYLNNPSSDGFERLWDNFFLHTSISKSLRERKDTFKKIIQDFTNQNISKSIRVMSLDGGPSREIKELFEMDKTLAPNVTFDCYDFSEEALKYASTLLQDYNNINFIKKSAIRLSLKQNIEAEIPHKYDLIYLTGTFDYLDETVAVKLIANLKKLLNKSGLLLVSNFREKNLNPTAYLMEWITEWNIIYRTKEEFQQIFVKSGFKKENLRIETQKSGIMQYALVN